MSRDDAILLAGLWLWTSRPSLPDVSKERPAMLTLRPMTEAEFERYYAAGIEGYAQERARNLRTSIELERVEAARQYAELLEDGLQTEDQHLWSVTLDTGEA